MGDKQFSIPSPWDKDSRIFIDCFGGDEFLIEVRGKMIRFEWSDRFGPMPVKKGGEELRSVGPRHPFWRAVSLWNLQGRRLKGQTAIWHEPKKPVLEHLGGRHYRVIEDGEKWHDW